MAENLVNLAVQAAGDYVAWVDINLIITPDYLPLLFQALTCSSLTIRITAVDAFIEVAGKGMPAAEKMSLYSVLTLKDMISQLLDMSDNIRSQAGGFDSNEEREEHFREKLAKLLAVALSELTKICDDSSASDSDKAQARESAFALGSLVLRFLGDPVDDITLVIIPSASTLLSVFKKEKKRNADGHLTVEKRQFLSELLQVTIRKMQYGPDADWVGAEDDPDIDEDEFKRFENLRRQLKILFDAVAWISDSLFHEICLALLASVVDTIDASGPEASGLSWQQVELATWVLYCIGDAAKGTSMHAFCL